MKLTATKIKKARSKTKPYKLSDGYGLYLLVNKSGKYWRYDYRYHDKRKTLAIGVYPKISLKEARTKLLEARQLVDYGLDPARERKREKQALAALTEDVLENVAREWHKKHYHTWKESYARELIRRLEVNVFPWLGKEPIASIEPPDILKVLRRIESRGALEVAHKVKGTCNQIFSYAVATGRVERNPVSDLNGALPPVKSTHFAALTKPKEITELLTAMTHYGGSFIVKSALQFSALVFQRPGEIRHARWADIDLNQALWEIPAKQMKMGREHLVPLSQQAIAVLKELEPITAHYGGYVFVGARRAASPMSENAVNYALKGLGFDGRMTAHGFRSMASTRLNESGLWTNDVIERQLAHVERNQVRAAYNRAEYLEERSKMMQWWADYLDSIK